jgi:hypothetical protein
MSGLADPGNKPLSSAKVKRGARMTAARQCSTLCERDHIATREGGDSAFSAASIEPRGCVVPDTALSQVMTIWSGHEPGICAEPFAPIKSEAVVLLSQMLLFRSSGPALSRLIVAISDDIASS